ncbi:MAG: 30S ribosomal protein S6, partial [bacterium]|nr:30S ribosomal protein S6 [bacterium]
ILQKNNAVVFEESGLTKVVLAYPIKKEKMAFFGYCRFTALPEAAAVIQEALKFQPEVLRVIFIKLSESAVRAAKANQGEIKRPVRRRETEVKKEGNENGLSNEDLEKKIEEILNI